MDTRIKIVIGALILLFIAPGCGNDLDEMGAVRSHEKVNERFNYYLEWSENNLPRILSIDSDRYVFLVGGDSHIGGTENMFSLLQTATSGGAVAVAVAGDVTTGKKEDYETADSVFGAFPDIPVYLVPGNHDLYFGGWDTFRDLFGPSAYPLEIVTPMASDLFIFLDNGSGTLGNLQMEWLKSLLENERQDFRYAVVIAHINFFRNRVTGSTNPLNEELRMLLDLFSRYRVNLVIQGHDHERYIEEFGNTTYITLDAMKDGLDNASYLQIESGADSIRYTFHDF